MTTEDSHPNLNFRHIHPDYGFHIPKFISHPFLVGLICICLVIAINILLRATQPGLATLVSSILILLGSLYFAGYGILNRITNLERRLFDRDKLLDAITWRGDETVLDVGCGNGILILGAVKRLTTGSGIGIDIWTEGSGENTPEIFQQNALAEGVTHKVSLQSEDVRKMSFPEKSFDVVMSGLTMHHLTSKVDYEKAIGEMIRVLRPGGQLVIYDEPFTTMFCAKIMNHFGLQVEKKNNIVFGYKPSQAQE